MGKRVKAVLAQEAAAAGAPGATQAEKDLYSGELASYQRMKKKKGFFGGYGLGKTIMQSPLNPAGMSVRIANVSRPIQQSLLKGGGWKSLSKVRKGMHQIHSVTEDPTGRKERAYRQASSMLKSSDPSVRAQGKQLYDTLDAKAKRQILNDAAIAATVYAGASAIGAGGGTAGAAGGGTTGAGEGAGAAATGTSGQGLGALGGGAGLGTTEAGTAATTGATTAGTTAGATGAGTSLLSKVAPYAKYAVPLIASMAGGAGKGGKGAQGQLGQISAEQQALGEQLLNQYKSGTLQPWEQSAIDQYTKQSKAQMRQQMANAGISDSTMMAEEEAKIDANATQLYGNFMKTTLSNGMQALGYAVGPTTTLLNTQLQQDQNLQNAWTSAANIFMQMMAQSG